MICLTQIFDKRLVLIKKFPNTAFKRGKTILFESKLRDEVYVYLIRAEEAWGEGWGKRVPFPGAKILFSCKIVKHNIFTCE